MLSCFIDPTVTLPLQCQFSVAAQQEHAPSPNLAVVQHQSRRQRTADRLEQGMLHMIVGQGIRAVPDLMPLLKECMLEYAKIYN